MRVVMKLSYRGITPWPYRIHFFTGRTNIKHLGYSYVPSLTAFVFRCISKENLDVKRDDLMEIVG